MFTTPRGAAVLSQSCDIVRSHKDRPYIQVAALTPARPEELIRAKAGQNVRYGYLAPIEPLGLVVDFDVVSTVDKELAKDWGRVTGCEDDEAQREFARSLARHRQRFAFPEAFNDVVKPMRRWLESKRSADSANGRFVRAIREIRVTCDDWEDPSSLVFIILLSANSPAADAQEWFKSLETLEGKLAHADFPRPTVRLLT